MALDADIAQAARDQYLRERDRFLKLARYVGEECRAIVTANHIPATVQYRAKEADSLYEKLLKYTASGNPKAKLIDTPMDALRLVGDLAGVRIATYVEGDRERVVELVRCKFKIASKTDGTEDLDRHEKDTGYRATHCQVLLPQELAQSPDAYNIKDASCEIQVCSMLAHVWNEIEHDIRYKLGVLDDANPLETSLLQELRRKTIDGDDKIEQLLMERSRRLGLIMLPELAALFPSSPYFELNAEDVLCEMVRLGYSTVDRVKSDLLVGNYEERSRRIVNAINSALESEGRQGQGLNADTADALLALILAEHASDMSALHYSDISKGNFKGVTGIVEFVVSHGIKLV